MASIPQDIQRDSTLALLSEGYTFIGSRCERYQSDLFETRLMLQRAICMTGAAAAEMFYTPDRFTRQRALPPTTLMLLQDKGSVQLLNGEAHRWRKQMFMSLMAPDNIERLGDIVTETWQSAISNWSMRDAIVLHDRVQEILCRSVCQWAGVPLANSDVRRRAREFGAMIDGAGSVGPRNWLGLFLRSRTERWIRDVIEMIRSGTLDVPEASAAYVIAWHRNPDDALLGTDVAAIELINVLRPTVAVARFITFAALALHQHPEWRVRLGVATDDELEMFVQEVRRYYPFFPFVAGRVRQEFDWSHHHFAKGTWVLLDLYGTNRDARVWEHPDEFLPDRFQAWDYSAYSFIPQGAGDVYTGHRCPGEWITIALMKRAVRMLVTTMDYDVPEQNLQINLSNMPAIPRSRFVINNVRPSH